MKTRDQIYGRWAAETLRDISMYRVLTEEQLLRLHAGKSEGARRRILRELEYMVKNGRVCRPGEEECGGSYYCAAPDALEHMDRGLLAAVWVLTDFIDQVEFHSVGDYPAKLIFFAGGEVYEVIHAAQGREVLLSYVLAGMGERPSRYLVLVDDPAQIEELQIPNASAYCTVSPEGTVQYFRKEVNDTA